MMGTKIRDVMMDRPASIRAEARISEAVNLLLEKGVAELYVTDANGRLKGVVPEYEFLKAELRAASGEDAVESLMSPNVTVVEPDCDVACVAALFRDRCHARVAVAQDGVLVGQISAREVLRLMVESKRQPADAPTEGAEASPRRARLTQPSRRSPSSHRPLIQTAAVP